MLNYEYDAEIEKKVIRQEGRREGRQEGRREGRQEGVELLGKLLQEGIPLEEAISMAQKQLTPKN